MGMLNASFVAAAIWAVNGELLSYVELLLITGITYFVCKYLAVDDPESIVAIKTNLPASPELTAIRLIVSFQSSLADAYHKVVQG